MTSQGVIAVVAGILAVTVTVTGISWLVLRGKRAFEVAAASSLKRLYSDLESRAKLSSAPPVRLRYHTYSGVLLWTLQTEHELELPKDVAQYALSRLLRHSLTWGFFAYGMVFIPFLALGNYAAQRASIRRQAMQVRGPG